MARMNKVNYVSIYTRVNPTPRGLEEWTEVTFQRKRGLMNILYHRTYKIISHASFRRITRLLGDCAK